MTADSNFSRTGSGSASQQGSSSQSQGQQGQQGQQNKQGASRGQSSGGSSGSSGSGGGSGKSQMQQAGRDLAHKAEDSAENAKSRVADQVRAIATAMRSASDELRKNDQAGIAQAAQKLEQKVEQAAEFLRNKSPGEIRDDFANAARREPVWFLGGAFMLGLLAARFLKSSGNTREQWNQRERDMWSRSRGQSWAGVGYGAS